MYSLCLYPPANTNVAYRPRFTHYTPAGLIRRGMTNAHWYKLGLRQAMKCSWLPEVGFECHPDDPQPLVTGKVSPSHPISRHPTQHPHPTPPLVNNDDPQPLVTGKVFPSLPPISPHPIPFQPNSTHTTPPPLIYIISSYFPSTRL